MSTVRLVKTLSTHSTPCLTRHFLTTPTHAHTPSPTQAYWNLAQFLPTAVGQYFKAVVGNFMIKYRDFWLEQCALRDQDVQDVGALRDVASREAEAAAASVPPLNEEDMTLSVEGQMKHVVKNELSDSLLLIVEEIHTHFSAMPKGGLDAFPKKAGSHLKPTSPALEFVKAVTHVLMLDASLSSDVAGLRR